MTRYGNILRFIKPLEEYLDKLRNLDPVERKKYKDENNYVALSFPIYDSDIIDFLDSVRESFVYNNVEVIESFGIKYENIDINKLDLSKYDINSF